MKNFKGHIVLIGTLLLFSEAKADGVTTDGIRCLVAGIEMSRSADASRRYNGMMTVMYYLGYLDRASHQADFDSLFGAEVAKMSDADMKTESVRCGQVLIEKGKWLQHIGDNLAAKPQSNKPKDK